MVYFYSEQTSLFNEEEVEKIDKSKLLEILQKFKFEEILALDCETNGLNPLKNRIIMLQIGSKYAQLVIDTRGFDFSILKSLLENPNILYIGHNIKFDYNMLKQYNIFLTRIYDTMVVERVIYNGKYSMDQIKKLKRYSLASTYYNYTNTTPTKTVREEFLSWGSTPFTLEQIEYGAKDVIYPIEIYNFQKLLLEKYNLNPIANLENKVVLAVGDIEYNGIKLNSTKWLDISKKYSIKIKDTIKELDLLLIKKEPKYELKAFQQSLFDVFERIRYTDINWNSPSQVYNILTNTFKIYPEDKDGKPSSGTKALELLEVKPEIVKKLIQFRKESKIISSFGKKFLIKYLHEDGRLRSRFNQIVDTGRMSSRDPNLQQIPSEIAFREAFEVDDKHVLIACDYSSQESRVMADLANDKGFIDFFNNGDGDMHSYVATKLFSVAYGREFIVTKDNENKEYRQKGKTLNFMISFGGSAFTLSKELKIPINEAENLVNSFFKGFPDLDNFFKVNREFAMQNGYIRTNSITNRIRWIPEWEEYQKLKRKNYYELSEEEKSALNKYKGRVQRKAQNTPIQGTSGDITKTALILLKEEIDKLGIKPNLLAKIKVVNCVHDEILVEATKEYQEVASKLLKKCMEKAGNLFCKKVELTAVPETASYWKH